MGIIEIGPRDEIKKLYSNPVNRTLKYCSIIAISITIVLLLVLLICMAKLSDRNMLLMKGGAGLFAIIFAVLYGVLVYRVNREYISKHNQQVK